MLLLAASELPALGLEPLVAFCACAVGLLGLGLDVGAPGLEPVVGAGRPAAADVGAVAPPATQQTLCNQEIIGRRLSIWIVI